MTFNRIDRLMTGSAGAGKEPRGSSFHGGDYPHGMLRPISAVEVEEIEVEEIEVEKIKMVPPRAMSSTGAVLQSVGVKALIIGVNILTGIITARALRPEGRGEMAAMIIWPAFLAGVMSLGVPSALTYQLRSQPAKQSQLMGAALLLAILSGAAAALLGGIFMRAWIPQYPPRVILFAMIFLLSTPIGCLLSVGRAGLESRGDFGASNTILIWSPASTLLWLLALLATHAMTPFSASLAYVPVGIAPLAWMGCRLWRSFRPSLRDFWTSAKQLLAYGIRAYGIDLCGTMSLYVDQVLVVRLLAPNWMGIYVVALSLSRMLNLFQSSVVMVLFPRAVSRLPEEVAAMTSRAMRMSTILCALGGIGIAVLGPTALSLLYGKEFRGASVVLRILVLEVVLGGAAQVLAQAFMALGRPGVITGLQVTGLALTVPLMLVLVPRFGIVGAGTALLGSTVARLIFVIASFPVFLKMRVPDLLPMREDWRFLARAVVERVQRFRGGRLVAVEGTD
jgi:O-antigen/teichoic acid export membrane protein